MAFKLLRSGNVLFVSPVDSSGPLSSVPFPLWVRLPQPQSAPFSTSPPTQAHRLTLTHTPQPHRAACSPRSQTRTTNWSVGNQEKVMWSKHDLVYSRGLLLAFVNMCVSMWSIFPLNDLLLPPLLLICCGFFLVSLCVRMGLCVSSQCAVIKYAGATRKGLAHRAEGTQTENLDYKCFASLPRLEGLHRQKGERVQKVQRGTAFSPEWTLVLKVQLEYHH